MPDPSSSRSAASPAMPRRTRTIVLCFDGTTNEYSSTNTNVIKFCSLLKKDNEQQLVYYQAGIGTYVSPGAVSPLFRWGAMVLDEAFAIYLSQHIIEGYKFLMQNWNIGDRVCLFGFSRGAYTARALAGMLHKVGLLGKDNIEQVPFAYNIYKSDKPEDAVTATGFKATFCRDVTIDFVGVWDTVSSVGIVMGRSLPFVQTNDAIKVFRHALSLDEHRAKFRPSFYVRPPPAGQPDKTPSLLGRFKRVIKSLLHAPGTEPYSVRIVLKSDTVEKGLALAKGGAGGSSEDSVGNEEPFETDMLEVWFAGCHSDVGGGWTPNTDAHTLANPALRWMVREVMKAECGVVWEESAFAALGIPFEVPNPDAIRTADTPDALQPLHDSLIRIPAWWILEVIPTNYTYQNVNTDLWVSEWSFHLGRGRYVPAPQANLHSSVQSRMHAPGMNYKPRARIENIEVVYVD